MDVRILADEDVTDKPVFDEPSAALEARIAVLEGTNLLAATLLPASTDLDGIDTPYEYYGSDLVNGPTDAPTALGIQVRAVGANRLQTAYSASGSSLDTWRRLRSSGTWGAWIKNASESYVDTMFQSLANSVTTSAVVDHTPAFVDDGTATDFVAAHTSQVFEGVLTGSDASGLWCDFMASVNATITYTTAGTSGVLITLPFATDETNVSGYAINARPTGNFPRHSTDIGMIAGSSTVDGLTRAAIGFERSIDGSTADVRFYALSEIPSGTAIGLVVWGKYKVAT
ncbi:MAG: pyocin knob domain-containing protein [Sulfitobacter sp.]